MTDTPTLGKTPAEDASRDAIHVAIIAATAYEDMNPGDHVRLTADGFAVRNGETVGIVDPFIPSKGYRCVREGTRVWVCLYPNTVTGMRHHWSHPEIDDPEPRKEYTKEESEAWLKEFAASNDCPEFDVLIPAACGEYIESPDPEWYGTYRIDSEYLFFSGRDAHGTIPPEFWEHLENYTGKTLQVKPKHFSCSC